MALEIREAASWIRIASPKIWTDATPWIASRVVQLVGIYGTTSGHCLRSKNNELAPMIGVRGI
jgi:hypothetical protein